MLAIRNEFTGLGISSDTMLRPIDCDQMNLWVLSKEINQAAPASVYA